MPATREQNSTKILYCMSRLLYNDENGIKNHFIFLHTPVDSWWWNKPSASCPRLPGGGNLFFLSWRDYVIRLNVLCYPEPRYDGRYLPCWLYSPTQSDNKRDIWWSALESFRCQQSLRALRLKTSRENEGKFEPEWQCAARSPQQRRIQERQTNENQRNSNPGN